MFEEWIFSQITGYGLIIEFLICSTVVILAGSYLAKSGDALSEITGLGGAWVGLILLAFITSIPELVSSLVSILVVKEPNLVFGNVFGSNIFNMMIIVILDFLCHKPILTYISKRQILPACFGVFLMVIATLGMTFAQTNIPAIGWISSVLIAIGYIVATRLMLKIEKDAQRKEQTNISSIVEKIPKKRVYLGFFISSAFIIASGLWLIQVIHNIGKYDFDPSEAKLILGQSFVGTIFLAIVTSLPELVVSIGAIRLKAHNMFFGNILGSNLFNMLIIPIVHLVYFKDIFSAINYFDYLSHSLSACIAIVLTFIIIIGLVWQSKKKFLRIGWVSFAMLTTYIIGMYIFFKMSIKY